MRVLELPRSVRLAAWGTAVLAGTATVAAAVPAVTGDDEPHLVGPGDGPGHGPGDLTELLAGLKGTGVPGLRVVLPVPGDVLGLPGPPAFNQVALGAGECVLTEPVAPGPAVRADPAGGPAGRAGSGDLGFVPEITVFGSAWEPGALVTWRSYPVRPRRLTVFGSLSEAERELRQALVTATEALARLDVARWRDDAAGRIAAVRDGGLPKGAIPPSTPGRCARVLATAARVRALVELAAEDDGAAVSSYEAQARATALRSLDGVCRRAMTAAVAGLREPVR